MDLVSWKKERELQGMSIHNASISKELLQRSFSWAFDKKKPVLPENFIIAEKCAKTVFSASSF